MRYKVWLASRWIKRGYKYGKAHDTGIGWTEDAIARVTRVALGERIVNIPQEIELPCSRGCAASGVRW